jgi:hypothetical protein
MLGSFFLVETRSLLLIHRVSEHVAVDGRSHGSLELFQTRTRESPAKAHFQCGCFATAIRPALTRSITAV